MIVATAGHVDHGKTTLVQALTGKDTDTLAEERRRGLTIDLGFAYFDAGAHRVGIVDVPGHERFVNNMLAGIAGIDAAMLVVAADEGICAQTLEHLRILDLLGLERGLVVLTKTDRADPAMLERRRAEVRELIETSFLAGAPILPTAAPAATGIGELTAALTELAATLPARHSSGNFRLAVDRAFNLPGSGLIVTGTVHAGSIATGAELCITRTSQPARVRSIFSEDRAADRASAGHRCALNLAGAARAQIQRGDWLIAPDAIRLSSRIDVRLQLPADGATIRHWMPAHVFHGAQHTTGRVALLGARSAAAGTSPLAQLVLDEPIAGARGDACVLRNQAADQTLAGARIIDVFAPRRGRANVRRRRELEIMATGEAADAIESLVAERPRPVPLDEVRHNFNLDPQQCAALIERPTIRLIESAGRDLLAHEPALARLRRELAALIEAAHASRPDAPGMQLQELTAAADATSEIALVETALQAMLRQGGIVQRGRYFCRRGFSPRMARQDSELWQRVESALVTAGTRPPLLTDLAAELDINDARLQELAENACRIGLAQRVGNNRIFLAATLEGLQELVQQMAQQPGDGLVQTRAFRDRAAMGRNLAIEVLEYFDTLGFTRRIGNARRVTATGSQHHQQ